MKNIIKLLTILGILLSAGGCVHENNYECPEEEVEDPFNITIDFQLFDRSGGSIFSSNISAVNMNIYDDEENLVQAEYITTEQLQQYQGVKLTLPAGAYNVMAWGNINDDYISDNETDNPYESSISYDPLDDRFGGGSGKVFYAPRSGAFTRSGEMPGCHTINVDPVTGYQGTLEFRPAYRVIKVYVEGYSGTPVIGMIGMPTRLTWLGMQVVGGGGITVIDIKTTEPYENNGIVYDYTEFETFHFDGSSSIILEVGPDGWDVFYSVLLNEIVEEIYDPDVIEISVLLKFTSNGVEVSIPDWHREDVDPGVGV